MGKRVVKRRVEASNQPRIALSDVAGRRQRDVTRRRRLRRRSRIHSSHTDLIRRGRVIYTLEKKIRIVYSYIWQKNMELRYQDLHRFFSLSVSRLLRRIQRKK